MYTVCIYLYISLPYVQTMHNRSVNLSIYSVGASCCLSAPEEWQQKVSDLAMRRVTVGGATEFLSPVGPGGLAVLRLAFGSASFCWMRSWISANASSWATRIEQLQRQTTWNPEAFAWFEFDPILSHHSLIFVSHSTTAGRTLHAEGLIVEAIWYPFVAHKNTTFTFKPTNLWQKDF